MKRCDWCGDDPLYVKYHDEEWGKPAYDDKTLFEFLILEGAQAGLSWITVLRKRENYRTALDGFDYQKIAKYYEKKVEELLQNEGIIRNRLKINSTILNAKLFINVQQEFGSFCQYIWSFVDGKPKVNHIVTKEDYPVTSEESDALSKDLKKRGFKFVGSTICYAHLQAAGLINDHSVDCYRRQEIIDGYKGV